MIEFDRSLPDYERYKQLHKGTIYIDEFKARALLDFDRNLLDSYRSMLTDLMFIESGGMYRTLDKSSVLGYLKEFHGITDEELVKQDTGDSLSQDVLEPLYNKGKATEFIGMYLEYTSIKSSHSTFDAIMRRSKITDLRSNFGTPLVAVNYKLRDAITKRVYTYEENIQTISYRYLSCIAAPEGKVMISTDFNQIEPRLHFYIIYRDPSLDEGFIRAEDTYEFMFNVTNPNYAGEFTKELRSIWKQPQLSATYGQHPAITKEQLPVTELAENLHNWLDNNEKRKLFMSYLKQKLASDEPITLTTFFGNRILIPANSKEHRDIKKLTNYPVQGTAHDIVVKYSLALYDAVKAAGCDIEIMMSRHDEPVFLINISDIPKMAPIAKKHSVIKIGDWKPMTCNMVMSLYYKEDEVINKHEEITEKLVQEILLTPKIPYFPIKEELRAHLYYDIVEAPDQSLLTISYLQTETSRIYGNVSPNPPGVACDKLILRALKEYPNYDIHVTSPLPLPLVTPKTIEYVESGEVDSNIMSKISIDDCKDHQIISTILARLIAKNEALLPMAEKYSARDFGFTITAV